MNDSGQRRRVQTKGAILLGTAALIGLLAFLFIFEMAPSSHELQGRFGLIFFGALGINVVSLICRWLVTRTPRRIYLLGRVPGTLGLAKLASFVALTFLIVFLIIGLIEGGRLEQTAFQAFVLGLVCFAAASLIVDGMLNAIVVTRHFRGTLAQTSRERLR